MLCGVSRGAPEQPLARHGEHRRLTRQAASIRSFSIIKIFLILSFIGLIIFSLPLARGPIVREFMQTVVIFVFLDLVVDGTLNLPQCTSTQAQNHEESQASHDNMRHE
jgi:hypothetical protein